MSKNPYLGAALWCVLLGSIGYCVLNFSYKRTLGTSPVKGNPVS